MKLKRNGQVIAEVTRFPFPNPLVPQGLIQLLPSYHKDC